MYERHAIIKRPLLIALGELWSGRLSTGLNGRSGTVNCREPYLHVSNQEPVNSIIMTAARDDPAAATHLVCARAVLLSRAVWCEGEHAHKFWTGLSLTMTR